MAVPLCHLRRGARAPAHDVGHDWKGHARLEQPRYGAVPQVVEAALHLRLLACVPPSGFPAADRLRRVRVVRSRLLPTWLTVLLGREYVMLWFAVGEAVRPC